MYSKHPHKVVLWDAAREIYFLHYLLYLIKEFSMYSEQTREDGK